MATATKGTRNGYGQEFHSQTIQNKMVTMKQAQAAVMTAEQAKEKWEAEVQTFLSKGIKCDNQQERILEIGRKYFKSVRKTQNTGFLFSVSNYSTHFLPPVVNDIYESATWIFKVGKNDPKLDELFPNLRNKQLQPIKREKIYSDNPDDNEEYPEAEIGNNKILRKFKGQGSMVDPLVVLFYCFNCHKCGDELLKVSHDVINPSKYRIKTKNYKIELDITANSHKEYTRIVVERR